MTTRPRDSIPYNIEAEQAVLSSCLLNEEVAIEIVEQLEERDFFRPSHQEIFATARYLLTRPTPIAIDAISIKEGLKARGVLEKVGGASYIAELMGSTISALNWRAHVAVVKRYSIMRGLLRAGHEIVNIAHDAEEDIDTALARAERALFELTDDRESGRAACLDALFVDAYAKIDEMRRGMGDQGMMTGFVDLDKMLAGLHGGDLVILAARPGVGKSTLALGIASNVAKAGHPVFFSSLEMSSEQLVDRILAAETHIDLARLRKGAIGQDEMMMLARTGQTIRTMPIWLDDTAGATVMQISAKARRAFHRMKERSSERGLIIVDYLQLIRSHTRGETNRAIEVGEITRGLKIMAKELDVPIIALSQLSRAIEMRANRRPQLSDLRESGSIEQDADIVMFIDRPMDEADHDEASIIIAKHRNGPTGTVPLVFDGRHAKFMGKY